MISEKNIVHKIYHVIFLILYCLLILSSILYNSAKLVSLRCIGWITLIFGIVVLLGSIQSRKKAHFEETLVESGIYAIVRHPEFLVHILIILSLILITQQVVNLVIGAILILLLYFAMIEEEKRNIDKFGDTYRSYMQRVPRINLLVGIKRMHNKKRLK
ncbi:hypothetical protein DRP05_00625 [Archaeoglobales archaeon]|nr:MAG: hypothetical protein DRP05_00625 [Archaeoglobales archaeon]